MLLFVWCGIFIAATFGYLTLGCGGMIQATLGCRGVGWLSLVGTQVCIAARAEASIKMVPQPRNGLAEREYGPELAPVN